MNAVELHRVSVRYERTLALDEIDLALASGMALGIVGPNGSGKSTLLKTIAGLLLPTHGTISVFGKQPKELAAGAIAYVPQVEEVDWGFPISVADVVAMGRYPHARRLMPLRASDRQAIEEALEALDLTALRSRHISELSGGQQQRMFLARAIAQNPALLLLDEPTTGVDAASEEALRVQVRALVAKGLPVIMTTHDLDRATEWFDQLMVVDHRILAVGDPGEVLASRVYSSIREHTHVHGHARH